MSVHISTIPMWVLWLFYSCATLAAFWGGSWQARLVAGSQFAQFLLHSALYQFGVYISGPRFVTPWRFLFEDLVLLSISIVAAVTARRYWAIWAASIGLVGVATDLLFVLEKPAITGWVFASAGRLWTILLYALVLWDVVLESRARHAARQAGAISP